MIEIKNLTCNYGNNIVFNGINLSIKSDLAGIVGPNGSGKTTLIKAILGVVRPIAGEVYVNGKIIKTTLLQISATYHSLGTIEWNFPVTVEQVVMMGDTIKWAGFLGQGKRIAKRCRRHWIGSAYLNIQIIT